MRDKTARSAWSCRYPVPPRPTPRLRLPTPRPTPDRRSRDKLLPLPTDERTPLPAPALRMPRHGAAAARRRGGDESVAAPGYRLDEARLPGVVAEHAAQLADSPLEYRVADETVAPHLIQKHVRGEQRAPPAHKGTQHGNGVGARGRASAAPTAGSRSLRRARMRRSARVPGSAARGSDSSWCVSTWAVVAHGR